MLTVLICVVVGFFTANHLFPAEQLWDDNFQTKILGLIIGGVAGLLLAAVISSISGKKEEKTDTRKLISLRGANYTTGDLFLGIGSINSSLCYLYYEMREDGGCVLGKMHAVSDNVLVYEEDRSDGVLEIYETLTSAKLWWGLDLLDEKRIYKFRIPKGSIKREFSL